MENPDKYDIMRWDVVMFKNSTSQVPMIYIKPDETFLEFVKLNNYAVMVNIDGTGTVYDNKLIAGVVNESSNVPNCRPNFYDKTGYYVITLYGDWYGYPPGDKLYSETKDGEVSLGCVSFSGLNAPENNNTNITEKRLVFLSNKPKHVHDANNSSSNSSSSSSPDTGMRKWRIVSVCLMLLVVILSLHIYLGKKD